MKAILPALQFHHCQCGGANVVAIEVTDDELRLAYSFGASVVINAAEVAAIIEITGGGAHIFLYTQGQSTTCFISAVSLSKDGWRM